MDKNILAQDDNRDDNRDEKKINIPLKFQINKAKIIFKLLENTKKFASKIGSFSSDIPTDRNCLMKTIRCSNQRGCQTCQSISSIGNFISSYRVRKFSASNVFFQCNDKMSNNTRLILAKHQNFLGCGTRLEEKNNYYQLDSFTLQTVISLLLENKLNLDYILSSYVCGYNGFFITKKLLTFKELNQKINLIPEDITTIFTGLIDILLFLQPYNFVYSSSEVKFSIDNGKIKVYLTDFSNSSISVKNFRLIPWNNISILRIKKFFLQDSVVRRTLDNTDLIFKVNPDFARIVSRAGIPLFVNSLDFYLIILKLMTNKEFYKIVRNNTKLNLIWESMWVGNEVETIDIRLRNYQNEKIFNLYRGLQLYCNVLFKIKDIIL